MKFFDFLKLTVIAMLLMVASLLLSKKADAGEYTKLIAIIVATEDGGTKTLPVVPVDIKLDGVPAPAKIKASPFKQASTATETVCVDGKCTTTTAPTAQACSYSCSDCTYNATPAAVTKTTVTTTTAAVASSYGSGAFFERGPVRRVLRGTARFIVKGGPIRQSLRANRQSRRAARGC